MDVKCPQCKRTYYETTDTFNPDVRPNGSMLRLKEPWNSRGWPTYGADRVEGKSLLALDMECTGCGAPLAPSGRLSVVKDDRLTCEICGKVCKNALGLNSHKRSHKITEV